MDYFDNDQTHLVIDDSIDLGTSSPSQVRWKAHPDRQITPRDRLLSFSAR